MLFVQCRNYDAEHLSRLDSRAKCNGLLYAVTSYYLHVNIYWERCLRIKRGLFSTTFLSQLTANGGFLGFFYLKPASISHKGRKVAHATRVAPLVVVPGDDLDQIAAYHHVVHGAND